MTDSVAVAMVEVPCDGCTACCKGTAVYIQPELGDNPDDYATQELTHVGRDGSPAIVLQSRADGACIYMGPEGAKSGTSVRLCVGRIRVLWNCFSRRKIRGGILTRIL